MKGRWIVLLLMPQWATSAPDMSVVSSAHAIIEQCAEHANAKDRGLTALRGDCPEIETAAKSLGLDDLLPAQWASRINARALGDLGALAERYAGAVPQPTLNTTRLRAIAKELLPPAAVAGPLTWWQRVKGWITRWLESSSTKWPEWLRTHWSPSYLFWDVLGYALGVIIMLAVIAVAVIEVRAARVPGARGLRRGRKRHMPAAAPTEHPGLELAAIEAAPLRERAVLALRLLVGALTRSHRLERDRNLTCRELISAARFDSMAQREQFQGLALVAERALYADLKATELLTNEMSGSRESVPPTDLARIRALYEALLATPGNTQSVQS